jgi:flagellar basal-body rod modification protein FlgD
MVDRINPNTITPGSIAEAAGGNKSLDQQAFLKLFVAQLKNQDPLAPQQNHEFVAQLAQFSSLEQSVGINQRLDQLNLQSRGLQNNEVTSLMGKQVDVRGNIVTLNDQDLTVPLRYTLDGDAKAAAVVIRDANGNEVRRIAQSNPTKGFHTSKWDGLTNGGVRAPSGAYSVDVEAVDADQKRVTATQNTQGIVSSVSFDQGFPVLHLDNGLKVPISDLIGVSPPPQSKDK